MTRDEGLQLEFEGLVVGLDERLVEELLTGQCCWKLQGCQLEWLVDFVAVPVRK